MKRWAEPGLRVRCDQIRTAVPITSVAQGALKLRRAGREWKACCPFHDDRTPSFTVYADDKRFMCFGCGAEGDVLDFVMRLHRIRLSQAMQMLGSGEVVSPNPRPARSPAPEYDRSTEAIRIWNDAAPAAGTQAESYLRSRGIEVEIPGSIRFANIALGRRGPMPALIAAVSSLEGQVCGIQRTFLSSELIGKARLPGGNAKFSLGRVRGGAIRLGPAARTLLVTEGLEDGLTLLQKLGRSVWVAAGAGMLPAMQLPDIVDTVVLAPTMTRPAFVQRRRPPLRFSQ